MGKLMDKLLGFIGLEMQEPESVNDSEPAAWGDQTQSGTRRGNVVSLLDNNRPVRLVVMKPTAFEQVQMIADHLKGRRPVIINLEETEKDTAKRILDFISGAAYALNGTMQKASTNIILLAPANVEVTGELTKELYDQNSAGSTWNSILRR